jgi:hypothetical protein
MPLYPFYTYEIGDAGLGFWLIRKDPRKGGEWLLVMCGPGNRKEELGFYATPHQAAYSVSHFQTGNQMWDDIASTFPPMADQIQRSSLDVLKNWERHDQPLD